MKFTLILLLSICFQGLSQVVEAPNVIFPEIERPKGPDHEVIFISCDAKFPGGLTELKRYFRKYKHEFDWEDGETSKRGYVGFIVEPDGSLMDIEVVRGISLELDDFMLRMIEEMPKWIPACDRYGSIRSRVRLPITFVLSD